MSFVLAFSITFSIAKKRSHSIAIPVAGEPTQPPPVIVPSFAVQDLSQTAWLQRLRALDTRTLPQLYGFCEDQDSEEHLDMVARYWTRTDPEGFLAFLSENPPFFKNESHAYYLFSEWGARDFESALEAAHALAPYNPMRSRVLRTLVKARFPKNPEQAIAALSEIYATGGGSGLGLWDEPNAEKHLLSLTKLTRGRSINREIDSVVDYWLKRDPAAAMEWIQNDIDALDSNGRFSSAMFELAQHDHEEALERFRNITAPKRRGELARSISQFIAIGDPEAAVNWLENEVVGWFQKDAAAEAANELAEKEPTLGANFAIRFENPRLLKRTIHEALKVFHNQDPQGMQSWANILTDETVREAVRAEIERLRQ